jgi:hypothetical protein
MEFNKSIIGPLVDPQISIMKNHPVTNIEVGLNDRNFERMCVDMGVSQHDLNADRTMKTGQSIEHAVEPELDANDFNLDLDSPIESTNPDSDFDLDLDLSGFER